MNESPSLCLSLSLAARLGRGLRFDDRLKLRHRDLSWCRFFVPLASFFSFSLSSREFVRPSREFCLKHAALLYRDPLVKLEDHGYFSFPLFFSLLF